MMGAAGSDQWETRATKQHPETRTLLKLANIPTKQALLRVAPWQAHGRSFHMLFYCFSGIAVWNQVW